MPEEVVRYIIKSKEMTILIYSYWKNRDMWVIFSKMFYKYWRNCLYEIVLVTDQDNGGTENIFDRVIVVNGTWGI